MTTNDSNETSSNSYETLGGLLRESCVELMTEYGLSALLDVQEGEVPLTDATAATIDFQGPELRGTIGLAMTPSVVVETYRAALGLSIAPGSAEAIDWTCELANQLIGRVKNKLRNYQVTFNVSTPQLRSRPLAAPQGALRNRFVCDHGSFSGYLDVLVAPGLSLVNVPPSTPLVDEGELLLF
jgi:hypothetical protein